MISFPPPYFREVWHYTETNTDLIRRTINKIIYNTKVNEKVTFFNKTILNVLYDYIPHETLMCDGKDPPWNNSRIKSLLLDENKLYQDYRRSSSNAQLFSKLNYPQEQLNFLVNRSR